tara:strand:+ start:3772 stop:3930 length:159 start_codon:yes stop_codon:yes gene_type:complete
MEYYNITTTINSSELKRLMRKLRKIDVSGVTVFNVNGYDEYKKILPKMGITT